MRVLGIVGSPRREKGLCHQVVSRVLEGAHAAGAETEFLYLVDEEPGYCSHCGHGCFAEGDCIQEEAATVRSRKVEAADALVLAAPVYVWQVNGLTAAFLDKVRLSTGPWSRNGPNGRPGVGIAVAGGTGSGVFPALQSIYAWLCLWKYRPLDPVPVVRFNLARVLEIAPSYGRALAEQVPQPFQSIGELMWTYDQLPYVHHGRADEFCWLAEQIRAGLQARGESDDALAVQTLLMEAQSALAGGDHRLAADRFVVAYQTGARLW